MKAFVIFVVIALVAFGVVKILGGQLGEPDWGTTDVGVTGPLAFGAVSRLNRTEKVWSVARESRSAKDREEIYIGDLHAGEVFKVVNHVQNGSILWVEIVKESEPDFRGFMQSPPRDPVLATLVRKP